MIQVRETFERKHIQVAFWLGFCACGAVVITADVVALLIGWVMRFAP